MRKALYFERTIGPYEAGEWYDNVPDGDYDDAVAHSLALPLSEDRDCGCKLTPDGRAVSVAFLNTHKAKSLFDAPSAGYCVKHLPTALKVPEAVENQRKRAKVAMTLAQHATKAGIIKGGP